MPDAVALVVKGGQRQAVQLVAQAGLWDAAPGDRGQGDQAICKMSKVEGTVLNTLLQLWILH